MKLALVPPNDPILNQVAQPIHGDEIVSEETHNLIEDLLDFAYGHQADRSKPILVGLAAPQVGVSKRIILVDTGADGHGRVSHLQVFINPEITWFSHTTQEWYEGCYSTDRVCGIVSRPDKIRVIAYNREGEQIEKEYEGYIARIFQHEIDHLNGREFVSHIKDPQKLHWVEEEEFPEYRDHEGWREWKKLCSFEKWEEMKGIRK